jgi:hypothetical protein
MTWFNLWRLHAAWCPWKFRNWLHKYRIFSDHFNLDSFCDCFLCLGVCLWGGFSGPSLLGMDCPTMVTVVRRAEASSDCCSCYSPIVAALYTMSWAIELQQRIALIASSKVRHLWVCSLDQTTVDSDSCKLRHKSVLLLYPSFHCFHVYPWNDIVALARALY